MQRSWGLNSSSNHVDGGTSDSISLGEYIMRFVERVEETQQDLQQQQEHIRKQTYQPTVTWRHLNLS